MAEPSPPLTDDERADAERRAAKARELADQALLPFRQHLTDEGYELLRADLIFQLLASPEGEAALARVLPTRVVDHSGEVERGAGKSAEPTVSSAGSKVAGGKG